MEFRILGPLEVATGDGPLVLPGGRGRSLLAMLVVRVGEVVSTERLIDELWGATPPPTATTALQGLVSKLRRCLEPQRSRGVAPTVLVTRPPGYVLAVNREQVDAHRFRLQVAESVQADPSAKASLLREALALWRGPVLGEFAYEPFAQSVIADLTELRITALEERIDAELALGRHVALVPEIERLAAEQPWRERLRAQLMVALYRCGRQADALEVYRATRRLLNDELGIEPGQGLQDLERAILTQDRSLEPPVPDERSATIHHEPARAWLSTGRKVVTVVFVDLSPVGAGAGSDVETAQPMIRLAYDTAASVLTRHGGTIEGYIGNVVVAVFGVPVAHEDDALRAARAGDEIQARLAALDGGLDGVRLAARIGINTGEVLVGDPVSGGTATSGPPVSEAARLQYAAAAGEVLVGESTRRLAGDAIVVEPTDRMADRHGGPPLAWRLIGVRDVPVGSPSGSPFVGRERELAELRRALDRAVRRRRAVLATVLGEPGIGKSRLAREFANRLAADALVATGRCPPYGEGLTFWPLREIIQQLPGEFRIDDEGDVLAGDPRELFRVVRARFEAVARQRQLVLVFEDVHWSEPTLIDLINNLAMMTREPLLILCLARPELRERYPRWAEDLDGASAVSLGPLRPLDSERLVEHRAGGHPWPADAVARIVETGQGNPLFLEQLMAASRDGTDLVLPPTIRALLVARLDRLGPGERDLLRSASVVGVEFTTAALAVLVPEAARPHLGRHLAALEARELVVGDDSAAEQFRFRHVLIHRAAYSSVTHEARSDLHERVADWIEQGRGPARADRDELTGHHLEQAFVHRRDLGRTDAAATDLARRAGERLASAGLRAYSRFDVPAAANLLGRARSLLPEVSPQYGSVLRRLAEAYPVLGRAREADEVFGELLELADRTGDADLARSVRLEAARFQLIIGPDPVPLADIREQAESALDTSRRAGDPVGMAQAYYVLAAVHLRAGRMTDLARAAAQGLACARRSGDLRARLGAPWWPCYVLLAGPTPVEEAIRTCEGLVDVGGIEHPGALATLGQLTAMTGRLDNGRRLVAQAADTLRERIRLRRPLSFIAQCQAAVERLAGDDAAAERALRTGLDVARVMKERNEIAQAAAELAILASRRGDAEEATRMVILAGEQAPAESVPAQALVRLADAHVRSALDDHGAAERLARAAVAAVPSDMLELRARAVAGLAHVLQERGRDNDALHQLAAAAETHRCKGNVAGARRLAELGRGSTG